MKWNENRGFSNVFAFFSNVFGSFSNVFHFRFRVAEVFEISFDEISRDLGEIWVIRCMEGDYDNSGI